MNKKILSLIFIATSLIIQSCTGPEGPQGLDGEPGVNVLGTTFDLTKVNFNASNKFQYGLKFSDAQVEVLESDAVLVYIYWGDQEVGGQTLATWRLMPQTAITESGLVQYNFDRTTLDFSVFMEGTFDLSTLSSDWTQNQTFRVVIIPADFAARKSGAVDYADYTAVKKMLNIDESKIKKIAAR